MKPTREKLSVQKYIRFTAALLLGCSLLGSSLFCARCLPVHAAQSREERLEEQRAMPIQSNEMENWPTGPVVSADAAILMEADTGTILYAKNIDRHEYPASTTKILTTLIATERCALDEVVTFSHDAVFDNPPGSSGIAMDVGQTLTMEQCLNAILIRSANEVCFAVAEHITGTTDWSIFAEIMNARAKELGAKNSNFVNPNGLPDENHYTTAYDLAMIGRAFFSNELLCRISLTKRLEIPASDTIPVTKLENNGMQIIPGGNYAYEYIVGCKTGYTDAARSCLVSCAEKEGLRLICVVLRDEAPLQYEDTISLFNYGFSNFEKLNVSQSETEYNMADSSPFFGGSDIFGSSTPLLTLNKNDSIILPRTATFGDTDSTVTFQTEQEDIAAIISYTYHGTPIGTVRVNFTTAGETASFDTLSEDPVSEEKPVIFINTARIPFLLGIAVGVLLVVLLVRLFLRNYQFSPRERRHRPRNRRHRKRRPSDRFRDYDF